MGSVDGRVIPLDELVVPVEDRGFLLGDAVYETLRTYGGRPFAEEAHLERLVASMQAIRLSGLDVDAIRRWMHDTMDAARSQDAAAEWVVRVTVTRGSGPHGVSPRAAGPPRVFVLVRPLPSAPSSLYTEGLRVVTARTRRTPREAQDPAIKAGSALNLVLARLEADDAGADEALLCNVDGDYLEATAANLVVVRDGAFYTARAADGVLEGVTMRHVADILEGLGLVPVYGPVPAAVVAEADEILLTQTTREVLPVVRVDEQAVGSGRPGPWATKARAAYLSEVDAWSRQGSM